MSMDEYWHRRVPPRLLRIGDELRDQHGGWRPPITLIKIPGGRGGARVLFHYHESDYLVWDKSPIGELPDHRFHPAAKINIRRKRGRAFT